MITIIFATYNGADTVGRMLKCFCELKTPPVDIEIIMVDNASKDATVTTAKYFLEKLPLKILHENNRGKNRALNYGINYAKGDLLLFTDDDILPDKDWLIKVWTCSEKYKNVDLFGGRILPHWDREPSPYFLNSVPLTAAYGITPDDLSEGPVHPGAIWGANMFVRKKVFEKGFRFNEEVGPSPGNYIMGSETEFNLRLSSHGYSACYCPDAMVQHIIRSNQVTKKWLKTRALKFGRGNFTRNWAKTNQGQITTLAGLQLGFPRWMLMKAINNSLVMYKSFLLGDTSKEIKHLWDSYFYFGYIIQGWRSKKLLNMV